MNRAEGTISKEAPEKRDVNFYVLLARVDIEAGAKRGAGTFESLSDADLINRTFSGAKVAYLSSSPPFGLVASAGDNHFSQKSARVVSGDPVDLSGVGRPQRDVVESPFRSN